MGPGPPTAPTGSAAGTAPVAAATLRLTRAHRREYPATPWVTMTAGILLAAHRTRTPTATGAIRPAPSCRHLRVSILVCVCVCVCVFVCVTGWMCSLGAQFVRPSQSLCFLGSKLSLWHLADSAARSQPRPRELQRSYGYLRTTPLQPSSAYSPARILTAVFILPPYYRRARELQRPHGVRFASAQQPPQQHGPSGCTTRPGPRSVRILPL